LLGLTRSLKSTYLPTGRALHYTLDDDAANVIITDEQGVNGTYVGGNDTTDDSIAGVIDKALDFLSHYIDANQTLQNVLTGSFSIGFHYRPADGQATAVTISGTGNGSGDFITLEHTKGNQLKATRILGINRNTLRSKIKEYKIKCLNNRKKKK